MTVKLLNREWSEFNFLEVIDAHASEDSMFELMEAYLEWNKRRDLFKNKDEWERSIFLVLVHLL